jgi:pimeloyl-ACP methyl ester carboxylesterase
MGGNAAMMYAGARPARVRRLVNLEGFGLAATRPEQAPGRYAQWLDEIRQWHGGAMALTSYDSADGVARRLIKTNPRLGEDKAAWLARHWAREGDDGRWRILGDAAHKIISAQLYRADEAQALYAAITAPVLAVHGSDGLLSRPRADGYTLAEFHQRLRCVRDCRTVEVRDAGHMLHHDQPQRVAALIEEFCS